MCRYAQSCAFISVIELPRIPAYYPKETFGTRLAKLRTDTDISAREMSLDLGQNPSYINRIENQKAFPSMQVFFYICEYLKITPGDFFDMHTDYPKEINELIEVLQDLNSDQLKLIRQVAEEFNKKK